MDTQTSPFENRRADIEERTASAERMARGVKPKPKPHIAALRRFAFAITALNVLGHTVLGFEQSWAQPLAALATTYSLELLLETIEARSGRRPARYRGGIGPLIDFLLAPHITGLACAMLLYANDRLWPILFAAAVAIGSKTLFRAPSGRGARHFLNPSNFGITVTLLLFPWVGIAMPYMFTENLHGAGDWILPAIIVASGAFLNARLTRRIPLIAGWLGGFAAQALLRHFLVGSALSGAFMPMSGVAFILFTFYMVTDPATTPEPPRAQAVFGASVAAVYGLLMLLHIVFGLFFALTLVCVARGAAMFAVSWAGNRSVPREQAQDRAAVVAPAPPLNAVSGRGPARETAQGARRQGTVRE